MSETTVVKGLVNAHPSDAAWVSELYQADEQYGGAIGWWRFWRKDRPDFHARGTAEHFWVLQPQLAFLHWRRRSDGVRVIDGFAVAPGARRQGYGTHLLHQVGRPVEIKVLTTAHEARAFCMAMGLQPMAKIPSARGERQFILFRGD